MQKDIKIGMNLGEKNQVCILNQAGKIIAEEVIAGNRAAITIFFKRPRGGNNAKKQAGVTVARKLAVLLQALWRSGAIYKPKRIHLCRSLGWIKRSMGTAKTYPKKKRLRTLID